MSQTHYALFLTALFLLLNSVAGFPGGAGGCGGGSAAVAGFHLSDGNDRPVVPGTLLDGVIRVSIEGIELTPGSPVDVPTNKDLIITVEAGDIAYLGLLIRLEAPAGVDTDGALVEGANTQVTATCSAPIVGITHTNNEEKTMSTGTIRFDEGVDGVQLDVTVVFLNNDNGSAYVYSRLPVNFRNTDTGATSSAPTTTTASDQTVAPTQQGADATQVPIAAPPSNAPINAPIVQQQPNPTPPSQIGQASPSLFQPPSPTNTAFDHAQIPPVAAPQQNTGGGFFNQRRPTTATVDMPSRPSSRQPPHGTMKSMKMMMMKGKKKKNNKKNTSKRGMMMMGKKGMMNGAQWKSDRPNHQQQKHHGSIFGLKYIDRPTNRQEPSENHYSVSGIFSRQ